MKEFGYKDKLVVGEREFLIHTGTNPLDQTAVSEVFESGHFIYHSRSDFELRQQSEEKADMTYIEQTTHQLHHDVMDEIRVLFLVNEKIKLIRQPMPHYRLANLFLYKNFLPEAVDNFQRVIALDPKNKKAHKRLALAFLSTGQFETAVDVIKQAILLAPNYPDLYNISGVINTRLHRFDQAKGDFQKAIQLKPIFLEANFNLGLLLFFSTIAEQDESAALVIPARVNRALNELQSWPVYQKPFWQSRIQKLKTAMLGGSRDEVLNTLYHFQIDLVTYEDYNPAIDLFFLKFMYGGKQLTHDEMELYELKIKDEATSQKDFADFWNELGIVHLVQCRDYFLKAVADFEKAIKINDKYSEAQKNFDLLKHNKNGFLILLRAILK